MCKTRNFELACAALGAPLAGEAEDPVAEAEAASSPSCENAKKDGIKRAEDSSAIRKVFIIDRINRDE